MKKITSKSDLAINGTSPAFDRKLYVGRPNIGSRKNFLRLTNEIINSGHLTNDGPLVKELEEKICAILNVKNCILVANGTIGLEIAIKACNLGGEVILPSYTFIATAHALAWQGIKPIFADISAETHNLDPDSVESLINENTTGIIGVHLWGRPCNISALEGIASKHKLRLIFDAAHAFGNDSNFGKKLGNFGDAEVFSFHATKFFNTFEGGAITTNNSELADKMRLMRNFGFSGFDNVITQGTNGKLAEINAAMGLVNLESMEKFVSKNFSNYLLYKKLIEKIPGVSILEYDSFLHSNYQYIVIEVSEEYELTRNQLIDVLQAENIIARKYFWPGCHLMKVFQNEEMKASRVLQNTEIVSEKVIVLPTGMGVSQSDIKMICKIISLCSSCG